MFGRPCAAMCQTWAGPPWPQRGCSPPGHGPALSAAVDMHPGLRHSHFLCLGCKGARVRRRLLLCHPRGSSCLRGSLPLENPPHEKGNAQRLTVPSLLLPAQRTCILPGFYVRHKSKWSHLGHGIRTNQYVRTGNYNFGEKCVASS